LQDLRAVVATEAQLYKDCVQTSYTDLDSQWNETATREWVRTQQVRAVNLDVLETAQDHSERCSVVDMTARRALQQVWRQDFSSNATTAAVWLAPASKSECDPTDRANLTQMLGPNGAVVENEVSGIWRRILP
jgi:hypothetical protein